jgi:hypothetical protein
LAILGEVFLLAAEQLDQPLEQHQTKLIQRTKLEITLKSRPKKLAIPIAVFGC